MREVNALVDPRYNKFTEAFCQCSVLDLNMTSRTVRTRPLEVRSASDLEVVEEEVAPDDVPGASVEHDERDARRQRLLQGERDDGGESHRRGGKREVLQSKGQVSPMGRRKEGEQGETSQS